MVTKKSRQETEGNVSNEVFEISFRSYIERQNGELGYMRTFGNKKYSRRNGTVSKMLEGQ
jgi:hypothetical protein